MTYPQHISHDLIGLIYETAQDPNLWPVLLDGLSAVIHDKEQPAIAASSADNQDHFSQLATTLEQHILDNELAQTLLPHFHRALNINRQLAEYKAERDIANNVLEKLPLGVMLVTADGTITNMNRQAEKILGANHGLSIKNQRLHTAYPDTTRSLHHLIDAATGTQTESRQSGTLAIHHNGNEFPVSLLIAPASADLAESITGKLCSIFIAAPDTEQPLSLETLSQLYQLTPAEARLTQLLVNGKSVEDAAQALSISTHTAKHHLKSVFLKTGTHRQAELIAHILRSPAVIHAADKTDAASQHGLNPGFMHKTGKEAEIRLKDGRQLCYADYGDPQGKPILFFHSIIASRLQGPPDTSLLNQMGIRLIVPDRPGFGRSTYLANRSLLDWADDIQQLADHLQLDNFYLAGYSAGGAYAAACAYRLPQRCLRLGLISSIAPFDTLKDLEGMKSSAKMLLTMARYSPALLKPFMRIMTRGILKNPGSYFKRFAADWPPADQSLLADPQVLEEMTVCFEEAVRHGVDGLVDEQFLLAQPWGFGFKDIHTDTIIWHGDADTGVPYAMAQQFAAIPNSRSHIHPGKGHLLILEYWQEIFRDLVA